MNKTTISTDDLSDKIDALRADLGKLVSALSDDVTDGIDKAGKKIGRTGREARETATETVTDHPLTAVGIAVGVGFLMGIMARKG